MDVRELFKLLLAILVSAGLTIAPLATSAMAEHSMAGKTMQMTETQMADMPDMASDMPCCPDKKDKGCQDCPLVAICMLSALPAKPSTDAVMIRLASHQPLRAFDDVMVDGLVRPPPDRPPRLLV